MYITITLVVCLLVILVVSIAGAIEVYNEFFKNKK